MDVSDPTRMEVLLQTLEFKYSLSRVLGKDMVTMSLFSTKHTISFYFLTLTAWTNEWMDA